MKKTSKFNLKLQFYLIISFALFLLLFALFYPRIGLSYHGNFHFSVVYQIVNGIIPPENVCLAGVPINYPWIFHLLLAAIYKVTGINLIIINQLQNLASFVIFIYFVYKAGKIIFKEEYLTYSSTLLSIFGINLLAVLFFLFNFPLGDSVKHQIPDDLFYYITPISDIRYATFFTKYLNVSDYNIGIFLVASYYYLTVKSLASNNINIKHAIYTSLTLLPVLFIHPFSALYISGVLIPSFLIVAFLGKMDAKKLAYFALFQIMVFIVSIPYLISITNGVKVITFTPINRTILDIVTSYPLHFIGYVFVFVVLVRKNIQIFRYFDNIDKFHICSAIITIIYVYLFSFTDGNDYKFVQLLSIVISPLIVKSVSKLVRANKIRWGFYLINFLIIFNLIYISYSYFYSNWANTNWNILNSYPIYSYIRKTTEKKDIVVDNTDTFFDLRGSYISQRRNYVVSCPPHTDKYPYISQKLNMIESMVEDDIIYIQSEFPESNIVIISTDELYGFDVEAKVLEGKYIYLINKLNHEAK